MQQDRAQELEHHRREPAGARGEFGEPRQRHHPHLAHQVFRVVADVRRGNEMLGTASRPMLVGGVDIELAEPSLNEAVLRRIAENSGGKYVSAAEAATVAQLVTERDIGERPTEMRDVWHNGISLLAIVGLLALEWGLRRRVGLA